MTSLTQLCRDLSIGKPRLYGILERLDIQPEQVGNKRLLDNDQVAKVRDALGSKTDRKPTETVQDRSQTDHKPIPKQHQSSPKLNQPGFYRFFFVRPHDKAIGQNIKILEVYSIGLLWPHGKVIRRNIEISRSCR